MQNLFKQYEGVFGAEEAVENSEIKKPKEKVFGFSPFALQDAVGEKSAKKAWLEYERLRIVEDIEAEELIHKIISKARDMLAISLGASKEDLNIVKDYPYNKSKRDAKNWQIGELKNFYAKLVEIYHRSRMESGQELDLALEKVLLNI